MAVYYWCPDADRPYGGVRAIYRHVDILNEHGVAAFVLHERRPFRCTWFRNGTRIAYRTLSARHPIPAAYERALRGAKRIAGGDPGGTIELGPDDVLVVPEAMVFSQMTFASAASKVIFNQNAYRTFVDWPPEMDVRHSPYGRPDLLAVLTGSLDNQRYLQTAFPGLPVLRARYSIDLELFHGRSEKERLIAYMPRKNRRESTQVLVQLQLRGALAGWTVVPVEGVTEVEVADVLRRASVFLSFGHPEGFGLPPVEAMRCGCVVIGYHGLGGREYFRPPHAYPIPFGDIRQYVETVEQLLGALETDPRPLHERAAAASELVAREYPPERQIEEVLDAWRELLDARAAGRPVEARRDPESGAPAAGASPD